MSTTIRPVTHTEDVEVNNASTALAPPCLGDRQHQQTGSDRDSGGEAGHDHLRRMPETRPLARHHNKPSAPRTGTTIVRTGRR
ncbi:hypothetical protein GCM10010415_24080 [Streptomyces atrovirens]